MAIADWGYEYPPGSNDGWGRSGTEQFRCEECGHVDECDYATEFGWRVYLPGDSEENAERCSACGVERDDEEVLG